MKPDRSDYFKFYNWLREFIVPGLQNSQFSYRDLLKTSIRQQTRWLDLGCGHQILPAWMPQSEEDQAAVAKSCELLVGLDRDGPGMLKHKFIRHRILGDLEHLPFRSGAFNLVTANMVVEHIKKPEIVLREVHGSLQPGGLLIFHTPNRWSYYALLSSLFPQGLKNKLVAWLIGRRPEDVFPTYYRMNSPRRLARLATENDFDTVGLKLLNSSAVTVMLGPAVIFELLLIRMLCFGLFRGFRSNIIAQFRKKTERRA